MSHGDLDFTIAGPSGLTSQGDAVTYSYDAATDTLTGEAGGRDVFTVQLDGAGGFTFELLDSLDHADGLGENALDLGFTVTGVPSAAAGSSVGFGDFDYTLTIASGLTSQGEALVLTETTPNNWTAESAVDGRDVFTFTLNSDGSYGFELLDSLDHDAANGENSLDLGLQLSGSYTGNDTDFDLDPVSGAGFDPIAIPLSVVDDVPVADAIDPAAVQLAATVDEDDLADGTDGSQSTTVTGSVGFASNDLITIDFGADGAAGGASSTLSHGDLDFTIAGPSGLTSQGDAVTYSYMRQRTR